MRSTSHNEQRRAQQEAYLDALIFWWLETTNLKTGLALQGAEAPRALAVLASARMLGYANSGRGER